MLISLLNAFRWTAQAVSEKLFDHSAAVRAETSQRPQTLHKIYPGASQFFKKHGLKIIPAIIFGLVQAETSGLNFEESS